MESRQSDRWESNLWAGRAVAGAVYVGPVLVAIVASLIVSAILPAPSSGTGRLLWWLALLGFPFAVFFVADSALKKYLPLAGLLRMTMVFPDKAPSRMAVARKAGSTRDLSRRLEDAKAQGIHDDPTAAAENILALASALNSHDHRTRGHSERVRTFADMIGEQMHLPPYDRDRLRWSALLHDIGKLGVHPDILNKTTSLTDEEFAAIKAHPIEGARIVTPLAEWLGLWANTVVEHHEKFDGSGYPYGLAGDKISLGGRIVAVADSYEVITAVRSYKQASSPAEARAELANCAGAHFDPDVVRAFLEISVGRLRRAGGFLAWIGNVLGARGSQLTQAAVQVGRLAAVPVILAGSVTVAALRPGVFSSPAPYVAGDLVQNGQFEVQDICPTNLVTVGIGQATIKGWTVGVQSVDLVCTYWQAAGSRQSLDMSGTPGPGSITQVVPTSSGATYTLKFYEASNPTCGLPRKVLHVYWDGKLVDAPTFLATGHTDTSMGWKAREVTLVATGPKSVLEFADATPDRSECGSALSDVSLYQSH